MDLNTIGGIRISRSQPKISIRITNNRDDISTAVLHMQRVGEPFEYAEYFPTRVGVDFLEFTFDELTFTKAFGRYRARLMVAGAERVRFYLHYENDVVVDIARA